jgi:hypothetical protein
VDVGDDVGAGHRQDVVFALQVVRVVHKLCAAEVLTLNPKT